MYRTIIGVLMSALALTACEGGGGGSGDEIGSSEDGTASDASTTASDTSGETGSDGMTTMAPETGETSSTGECGQSPSLFCDTMIPFYEDARAIHEASETDCQLLWIFGRGVGPEGILLDGVFMIEPSWIISYVCPGRRIEYAYSAALPEYPLVTEYVEPVDPSDFKQIEAAIIDSPVLMDLYAGTNCPDILTLDDPRFAFQPSAINQSDAVYEIGETLGGRAMILVDAQGMILETLPCP